MTKIVVPLLSVLLCLFTLAEVNYNRMQPQSALALFVLFGMALCFIQYPIHPKLKDNQLARWFDVLLGVAACSCCAYVIVQTEPLFESFWLKGQSLANRAGDEQPLDYQIGLVGLILVLEATRRTIGLIVPLLALTFVGHSYYCFAVQTHGWPAMPTWLLPHAGQSVDDIVATTYLQTLGVFGPAATVMFKYVFLFVVFGTFLEMSGATQFIIDFAERVFGRSPGGPAKVAVLGSGLMGSLSGSAVANAVTTGAFTIPMMRNAGFERHIAGGITAAAASGGALVPPVMGAGAYMMLELVQPQVTFLQVAKAALVPAILYYLSIFMIVHFYSKRVGAKAIQTDGTDKGSIWKFEAVVFFGALGILVGLLVWGFSPFKSVTGALIGILFLSIFRKQLPLGTTPRMLALGAFVAGTLIHHFGFASTIDEPSIRQIAESWLDSTLIGTFCLLFFGLLHPAWRPAMLKAFGASAKNGVSLVAASACVGIIIGIVQQTGIATDFSATIRGVVETNLFAALMGIMVCSLILGMGVPSVVCYLLMATLMGSLLGELGVIPLSAHLFIFYFGMMSMVTPPVALAAYASASIAEAPIMKTSFAAFAFSLVGFSLPFMFVYRPELTLQSDAPEVKLISYKSADEAGEPGTLRVTFEKFGKTVPGARVSLLKSGQDQPVTIETGVYGNFATDVTPGNWNVSLQLPNSQTEAEKESGSPITFGDSRHIGAIDIYEQSRDEASITDVEKQNFAFTWGHFSDQRLSIINVIMSIAAATIGIIALAAGLSGYLRNLLNPLCRILLFVSAAFLLYPGAGISIGTVRLPVSDLIGCVLFAVTIVIAGKAANEDSSSVEPAAVQTT
ncbi:MAG: TRAP transporter fused permease subunit [Rhodopirellula sp.]|nr:TRAP transporter fused permease subunit [Rhodopirellula sp.]